MKQPVSEEDRVRLALYVANIFDALHGLAYAQLAPDLTVVQASPNFQALTVEPTSPVEGRVLADLLWEFIGAEQTLAAVLQGKEPDYLLERVHRDQPDGSTAYLTFHVSRLNNAFSVEGLLLIIENTTSTAHLEQRLRQERNELRLVKEELVRANLELDKVNRFKSFLLSMAAHDMSTPLTAIHGFAELLTVDPVFADLPRQKNMLVGIRRQSNQLKLLIMNLLDLGQIEQGRLQINFALCDLNNQVREVVETTQIIASRYEIDLSADLPNGQLFIEADASRIRQILQNLIGNALKYTKKGGMVQVKAGSDKEGAIVQVIDTGRGMTEGQLKNLFKLYYRTDEARSKAEGSGLGLHIVKTLVEAQRGHIGVVSQRDKGTTVTVRFPLNKI